MTNLEWIRQMSDKVLANWLSENGICPVQHSSCICRNKHFTCKECLKAWLCFESDEADGADDKGKNEQKSKKENKK